MDATETKLYYGILICCLLLGLLFVFFIIQIVRRQQKFYAEQRSYMLEESAIVEQERKRIAHDLHDDMGPLLSILFMQVSKFTCNNAEEESMKQKSLLHIKDAIDKLTFIASNLTPRRFRERGLQQSIKDYFRDYKIVSSIHLSLGYEIEMTLPEETAIQVYRIVQELVHNAVKHSGAKNVNIHLKEKGSFIYLDYEDDGQGLKKTITTQRRNDDQPPRHVLGGLGMQSLLSRIQLLGGTLLSENDAGTAIFIELPKNIP